MSMNTIKTRLLASLIPLFTVICLVGYWFAKDILAYKNQPLAITEATQITVTPGTSLLKLTQELEDKKKEAEDKEQV